MLDVALLFKIAAIGIIVIVLDGVLKSVKKDEFAVVTNLTGIVIILLMVMNLISKLFLSLKTLFQF